MAKEEMKILTLAEWIDFNDLYMVKKTTFSSKCSRKCLPISSPDSDIRIAVIMQTL